jgi:hypothetical protein
MYYIYELVEGANYPALKARQRAIALATAKSKLRRKSLDVPDVICTYGCDASEEDVEAAVLAETGYKTAWIRYTLKKFCGEVECGPDDVPRGGFSSPANPARGPASPASPARGPGGGDRRCVMAPRPAEAPHILSHMQERARLKR